MFLESLDFTKNKQNNDLFLDLFLGYFVCFPILFFYFVFCLAFLFAFYFALSPYLVSLSKILTISKDFVL